MKIPRKKGRLLNLETSADELLAQRELVDRQTTIDPFNLPFDPKVWMKEHLVIQSREGGLELFDKWTYGQETSIDMIMEYRMRKEPLILVNHKIRQVAGKSTVFQGFIFCLLHHLPERQGLVAAHMDDATVRVFNNVIRFYQYLENDEKEKKPVLGGKAHISGLRYDFPHNSQFHVMTAGSEEAPRSGKYNYWHLSEYAFFPKPELFYTALVGADTTDITADSLGLIESTANGPNEFEEVVHFSQDPKNSPPWRFVFDSWLDEPRCIMQVPADFEFEPKETEYAALVKKETGKVISNEQMMWHRWKRRVFKGSWPMIKQEFPSFSKEAFDYTGEPWFLQERIRRFLDNLVEPIFVGELKWASTNLAYAKGIAQDGGHLLIWEHPEPGVKYVLGGDYAYGVSPKGNYTELSVHRLDDGRQVAHYRNNLIQTEAAANYTFRIGAYYNDALVGVEWNGPGQAVLQELVKRDRDQNSLQMTGGYLNLYYDVPLRDENPRENTARVGFATRRDTKTDIMSAVQNDYNAERITVYSRTMLLQMYGYAFSQAKQDWVENHKDPDTRDYNDDGVMSVSIANKMRRVALNLDSFIQDNVASFG